MDKNVRTSSTKWQAERLFKRSVRFEFEILCHCNTPREREHNLTDFPFILVKYEIICNVKTVVDESAKSHKSSFQ